MKSTTLLLLIIMILFGNSNCASEKNNKKPAKTDCFSEANFYKVFQYIENQLAQTENVFFAFENYEIYPDKAKNKISLKRKNHTQSLINSKGIYSLNKSQKGNEKMVNEINQLFCRLYQLSTQESIEHLIPEEIKKYIDSTTIFLFAEISRNGFEPLANHLYMLNNKQVFTRISNKTNPENDLLFSSDIDLYQTEVKSEKYEPFLQYIDSICTPGLKVEYKTPDNLQVNGGAITYVYIKSKQATKWLYFEPESASFFKQLEKELNKIFE